jgi:hypothetical protein
MYQEARCESHCAVVAGDYISNDRDCRLLGHLIYGAGEEAIGAPLSLAKKTRNLADLVWLCRAPERDPCLPRDGERSSVRVGSAGSARQSYGSPSRGALPLRAGPAANAFTNPSLDVGSVPPEARARAPQAKTCSSSCLSMASSSQELGPMANPGALQIALRCTKEVTQ